MPVFEHDGISLHYEEYGSGYPLFLLAPGGMRSAIDFWHRSVFDPTAEFTNEFRVIAMDQRNAGSSRGPVRATHGWQTFAQDQLALLDHLGVERCHIMGGCIGCTYCLGLIAAAPQRITAAVLQKPIGLTGTNRVDFEKMFDEWGDELVAEGRATREAMRPFRDNMFGGDFVFAVDRDFVRKLQTPLLILAGDDNFHPTATAREIDGLAPHSELLLDWQSPGVVARTVERVRSFLQANTPVGVR